MSRIVQTQVDLFAAKGDAYTKAYEHVARVIGFEATNEKLTPAEIELLLRLQHRFKRLAVIEREFAEALRKDPEATLIASSLGPDDYGAEEFWRD